MQGYRQICYLFFAPFGTYSVSFWFFYHPCYWMHIKFFILCQYIQVFHQPPLQHFALVVLQSQVVWLQLAVMPFSVLFVGVSFLGLLHQALGFICCLALVTFGFIAQVSVSFVLCPFRALYNCFKLKNPTTRAGFLFNR